VDDDLRQAWGAWLGTRKWDHFITVTFREMCPAHRSESVMNSILKTIQATTRPHLVFLGTEKHLSHFIHVHGLIQSREPDMLAWERTALYTRLFDVFGRSKVEAIRGQAGVTKYVSKYCVKSLEGYMLGGRQWS